MKYDVYYIGDVYWRQSLKADWVPLTGQKKKLKKHWLVFSFFRKVNVCEPKCFKDTLKKIGKKFTIDYQLKSWLFKEIIIFNC